MVKTRNFADVVRQQMAQDSQVAQGIESELTALHAASLIYEARKRAGLTQAEMAERVGTHQSVIARLEDSEYDGHSVSMLMKVAAALDCRLKFEFEPLERPAAKANGKGKRKVSQTTPPNHDAQPST
jgi:ribosome-binding protein aMBF1 (putative translation factor)